MKPWQHRTISTILDRGESVTSGTMHAQLEFDGLAVSRASIVNYLLELSDNGIITREGKTGKGGTHGLYSKKLSDAEIVKHIFDSCLDSLIDAFPKDEFLRSVRKDN